MTDIQKQKIQWLSRAFQEEQLLSAMLSVRKQQKQFLRETDSVPECSLLMLQLEALEKEIHQQTIQLALVREEIRSALAQIPDIPAQAICLRKYLAYETNEQIAEEMFYDVRTVQRKHKTALEFIP